MGDEAPLKVHDLGGRSVALFTNVISIEEFTWRLVTSENITVCPILKWAGTQCCHTYPVQNRTVRHY
jgi:hypothetical protein